MSQASIEGFLIIEEWSEKVVKHLENITRKLNDKGPLLRAIGHWAAVQFRKNIAESHDPRGVAFAPLKKPRRKGHNPSEKPLADTLALFDDIQFEEDISDSSVAVGNSSAVPYAIFQNDGTRTIPAREYLGISEDRLSPVLNAAARMIIFDEEEEFLKVSFG